MFGIAKRRNAASERGDWVSRSKFTGRRVPVSACLARGFSLIELVITITVLTILTLGVMPLVKVAVRRQKEQQLRDSLRQIRMAIEEFHRDTFGMVCTGTAAPPGGGGGGGGGFIPQPGQIPIDPRSQV